MCAAETRPGSTFARQKGPLEISSALASPRATPFDPEGVGKNPMGEKNLFKDVQSQSSELWLLYVMVDSREFGEGPQKNPIPIVSWI